MTLDREFSLIDEIYLLLYTKLQNTQREKKKSIMDEKYMFALSFGPDDSKASDD